MASGQGGNTSNAFNNLLDRGMEAIGNLDTNRLLSTAVSGYLTNEGVFDPKIDPAGFQGKVVKQTPVRSRLDLPDDPDRRPGAYGRRYFTDTKFLKEPIKSTGKVAKEAELGAEQVLGGIVPGPTYGTKRVLGDVVAEADQDTNKQYTESGREILMPSEYKPTTSLYDDRGYEILTQGEREEGRQYTDEGRLIQDTNLYDPTKDYSEEGFEIISPAQYYTNLYAPTEAMLEQKAALEAKNQAIADQFRGIQAFEGINAMNTNAAMGPFPEAEVATAAQGGLARFASPYDKTEEEEKAKFNVGGGIKQLAGGRYLDGMSDGMADKVPASIEGTQPAALSDGEFVVPADVVSGLGNGSSNAGAKVLNDMMTKVRKERTGNPQQGKEINPQRVMAKSGIASFANGGPIQKFQTGTPDGVIDSGTGTDASTGMGMGAGDDLQTPDFTSQQTGTEDTLPSYLSDYVTDYLGRAQGLADAGYEAYYGPLTAGESDLQQEAFSSAMGIDTTGAGLGSFGALTPEQREAYMDPYLEATLDPEIRRAEERAEIARMQNAARMAQAGSFGGSRQAIQEGMMTRDTAQQLADIENRARSQAFQQARDSFDRDRKFGLDALQTQTDMGGIQRDIEAEGIAADKAQFEEERDFQYKMPQFLSSLLQNLPTQAQNVSYSRPSTLSQIPAGALGIEELFGFLGGEDGTGSS